METKAPQHLRAFIPSILIASNSLNAMFSVCHEHWLLNHLAVELTCLAAKTSLMAVFEAAKTKYGAVDILVNNAAGK